MPKVYHTATYSLPSGDIVRIELRCERMEKGAVARRAGERLFVGAEFMGVESTNDNKWAETPERKDEQCK